MQSQAGLLPAVAEPPLQHSNRTTLAWMRNSQVIKSIRSAFVPFRSMNNNRTSLLSAGLSRHTASGNPLAAAEPEIDTKKLLLPQQAQAEADMGDKAHHPVELKTGKKNEKCINGRCDKAAHARTNKGNSWEEKHVRQKKMQS